MNLIQADQHAARIGSPLIAFVSIRWALTEQGEASINTRWSALLNAFRNWASRQGFTWAAVGVHENPPPEPAFNSHLLAHIPADHLGAATEWLMKTLGGSVGAVHVRPRVCPGWDADDTLSYMLKGTDKATAMRFNLIRKHGWKYNQGNVPFRRSTCSQNINANARREFSYQYVRVRKAA